MGSSSDAFFSFALFCFCGAAVDYSRLGGFGQDVGVWDNGVSGLNGFVYSLYVGDLELFEYGLVLVSCISGVLGHVGPSRYVCP